MVYAWPHQISSFSTARKWLLCLGRNEIYRTEQKAQKYTYVKLWHKVHRTPTLTSGYPILQHPDFVWVLGYLAFSTPDVWPRAEAEILDGGLEYRGHCPYPLSPLAPTMLLGAYVDGGASSQTTRARAMPWGHRS